MNTTLKANKLIAGFMGLIKDNPKSASGKEVEFKPGSFVDLEAMGDGFLTYNTSWDSLMPVIRRIRKLKLASDPFHYLPLGTALPVAWAAAVNFIEWYNALPNPKRHEYGN